MRLFLDTANIEQIREGVKMGIISGVTTNPTLMAKEKGVSYRDRVVEICETVDGPVSAECTSRDVEGLISEGREISLWHPNVVVKIPIDEIGLEATSILSKEGIKINMTLCFQPLQALLVAKAGAFLVSPFVGRLDDVGADGMEVIQQIRTIYDNYGMATKILVASIRTVNHVATAAKIGADVATIPPGVVRKLADHPLTDKGLAAFLADWAKTGQKILS